MKQQHKEIPSVLSHFSHVRLSATQETVATPPDSFVHGIFPGRILEWVAMPSSKRFLTQGLNRSLLRRQAGSLPLGLTSNLTKEVSPPASSPIHNCPVVMGAVSRARR